MADCIYVDEDVLKLKLAFVVEQLEVWFQKNELILNTAKTCAISFHSSQCRLPYKPHIFSELNF